MNRIFNVFSLGDFFPVTMYFVFCFVFSAVVCILHPPAQNSTYFLYVNSIMQAVTIYAFAIYYGELTLADVLAFVAPMKGGGKGKGHDDVGAGESSEKELESQSEPLLRNTTHAKSTTRSDVHIV